MAGARDAPRAVHTVMTLALVDDDKPYLLSRREHAIIGALTEALYDPSASGTLVTPRVIDHVIREVEAWLTAPDILVRAALRVSLTALDLAPLLFVRTRSSSMRAMKIRDRVRYLTLVDAAPASPLSSALTAWKTLLGTAYFAHPVGEAQLGLRQQPPSPRPVMRRRRTIPLLPIFRAETAVAQ